MAINRYWRFGINPIDPGYALELSELQLFLGATRVDAPATLTASIAPTSGTLAALKDNSTGTGALWTGLYTFLWFSWDFGPSGATDVDGVVFGARTTASRFPTSGVLQGGPAEDNYTSHVGFGGARFVSAALTPVLKAGRVEIFDVLGLQIPDARFGGRGRLRSTVKIKGTPDAPTHRETLLYREEDKRLIRRQWSREGTGNYDFQYIDETKTYYVIAFDYEHNYRAVIADNLSLANGTLELMP